MIGMLQHFLRFENSSNGNIICSDSLMIISFQSVIIPHFLHEIYPNGNIILHLGFVKTSMTEINM